MRAVLTFALCFVIVAALAVPVTSQDKAVTLTGKITCAKCNLNIEKTCMSVMVVKSGGKDVIYYLDEKFHQANHEAVCKVPKEATITGTLSEKGGKKYITATKIELKK